MGKELRLVTVVPAVQHGSGIRFFCHDRQIDIEQHADVIWTILDICDGTHSEQEIVDHVKRRHAAVDSRTIHDVITDLIDHGIVKDSYEVEESLVDSIAELIKIWRELVGKNKQVRTVDITVTPRPDSSASFFAARAVYADTQYTANQIPADERVAIGIGNSAPEALVKAIGEAYERYACSLVRVDETSKAINLKHAWLDPSVFAPLTDSQYKAQPQLQQFSKSKTWQWVTGTSVLTGKEALIPIDLAFCPINTEPFGRKLCYEASTSGVAAFMDEQSALKLGLLELIERDALMRNWFQRKPAPKIAKKSLPEKWRDRFEYWQSNNRDTHVINLSNHGIAIILVCIVSDSQYPSFSAGAAASCTSYDEAISKAFLEAEEGLLEVEEKPKTRRIDPQSVTDPFDHEKLYNYPDHLEYIRWLWSGQETESVPEVSVTFSKLLESFSPISVKLSPDGSPLTVVRVLSEKLVPINFGFGTEHYSHPLVRKLLNPESLLLPHYFS